MSLKIYEHKSATYLSTYVTINGEKIPVVFEGGSRNNPTKVTSKYACYNPEIQKIIESWPDFGKGIVLFYAEKPAETAPERPVVIPEGFEEVKGITTAIEAKDYILNKFPEVKHAELKNTAMIKEVAEAHKIVFSELI